MDWKTEPEQSAHCFQLDFRKKIFRIFRIFEKTPNTKIHVTYLFHQTLFTEIRSLEKKVHDKKTFKKSIVLKLSSSISPKPSFPKTTESELLAQSRKMHFTGAPENIFLRKVDTHLKLP